MFKAIANPWAEEGGRNSEDKSSPGAAALRQVFLLGTVFRRMKPWPETHFSPFKPMCLFSAKGFLQYDAWELAEAGRHNSE